MNTIGSIAAIVQEPRDPAVRAPSNESIRGLSKKILRSLLQEIQRRQQLDEAHFGSLTQGEERLAKIVINTYRSATEELAAENPLPAINLGDLTPEILRQIVAGEHA